MLKGLINKLNIKSFWILIFDIVVSKLPIYCICLCYFLVGWGGGDVLECLGHEEDLLIYIYDFVFIYIVHIHVSYSKSWIVIDSHI
jgi:hypothetical protein